MPVETSSSPTPVQARPASRLRPPLRRIEWALLVLLHVLPFATRPALVGGDEPHYALAAHSLAVDRDLELANDYAAVEAGSQAAGRKRAGEVLDRHLRTVGGREVFAHPAGLPLLAAPAIALLERLAPGAAPDLLLGLLALTVGFAGLVAGIHLLGLWLGDERRGAWLAVAIYLSSPLWFYSRVFMTEAFTWAFAALAVERIARGKLGTAAVLLALTLAMKETALLLVGPILLAAAVALGPRAGILLSLGPAAFALSWVLKNLALGLPALTTFQRFQLGDPLGGALGLWIDSRHGLLWFAPLLCCGLAGLVWPARAASLEGGNVRTARAIAWAALAAFAGYFVVSASWADWRGGSCFGPRLLVPVLPALAIPLASFVTARRSAWCKALLAGCFVAGFTVQWCAALDPVPAFWSSPLPDLLLRQPGALASGLLLGLAFVARLHRALDS